MVSGLVIYICLTVKMGLNLCLHFFYEKECCTGKFSRLKIWLNSCIQLFVVVVCPPFVVIVLESYKKKICWTIRIACRKKMCSILIFRDQVYGPSAWSARASSAQPTSWLILVFQPLESPDPYTEWLSLWAQ